MDTLDAAAGVAAALGPPAKKIASTIGIDGSMVSGVIEYLTEGTSTKRVHAGWSAQAGIHAALMGAAISLVYVPYWKARTACIKCSRRCVRPSYDLLMNGFG